MKQAVAAGIDIDFPVDALPVLYSFRRCPYAMRARLAISASGQRCELREVVLRDKPAGLIAASPKATVPVLVLPEGKVLEQSLDIMRWALALHDPQDWLPRTAADQDATEALIARCDGEFKQHLDRYKYPNRYVQPESVAEAFALTHRREGAAFISTLEQTLDGAGQGLIAARWSLADAAILPFVRQFAATDPTWFDAQPWPAVRAWLAPFIASPPYLAVMQKYPRWQDGTPGTIFPC